jgi:hypothetical protein
VRARLLLALLYLGVAAPVSAQAVRIQASVDRARTAPKDPFSFTVVVESEKIVGASDLDLGLPNGIQVLRQSSSTSTSIQIVGGSMTQTRTITSTYTLQAEEAGTYVLGPVKMEHEGASYASKAVRVEAVKGLARPRTSSPSNAGSQSSARQLQEIEKNLFIRSTVDRDVVFVGEQVVVSYDLYSRFQLQNVRYGHLPSFTGFWTETVFDASRLEQRRTVVDGQAYNRSSLKKVALFPTAAGAHELEQLEVQCDIPVRSRRRSLFDADDFMGFDPFKTQQVTVRADDVSIVVKPLPKGAPETFTGAVGQYSVSVEAQPREVRQGDPITLIVKVSGRGNLHAVGAPRLGFDERFKAYDPKTTLESRFDGQSVVGHKTFEFVVIPSVAGDVELPPIEMAYFDPTSSTYQKATGQPIVLHVLPAPKQESVSVLASSESIRLLGEDIRHIKGDVGNLVDEGGMIHESPWFLAFQAIPVVGFLGALIWHRHRSRLLGDVAYARRRRSRREAQKRLAESERLMTAGEAGPFHSEIDQVLSTFLADRLNLSERGLTPDRAARALRDFGADSEAITLVVGILQACDLARFAPDPASDADMQALLDRTREAIETLGRLT